MKRILTHSALAAVMALGALSPSVMAKTKHKKASPEHIAAVKKCQEDYEAAMKEAMSKKGKERNEAKMAARKARKECKATAPK